MAKRTVYLRYGNKTRLFKASLQRAIEEWIVPVDRLRAAETDDAEETLLRIGQLLVANILSPAGLRLMRITNAESARMPEIGAFTSTRVPRLPLRISRTSFDGEYDRAVAKFPIPRKLRKAFFISSSVDQRV